MRDDLDFLKPDGSLPTPIYLQLGRALAEAIKAGRWRPDEALPSERVIAERLGVSRVTTRKAFDILFADGLICRRQGSGTFITPLTEQPLSRLTNFTELITKRGFRPNSRWLDCVHDQPSSEEQIALGISPSSTVARLKRQRLADGVVMAVEITTLPNHAITDVEAVGNSLYAYLDSRGQSVVRALQHIRAARAPADIAELTGVEVGEAMLFISRIGYTSSGTAIELTHSWCRSDFYDFVAELHR